MNKMRRTLCQSMGGLFGLIGLGACSQPGPQQPQQIYTEEEKQRLYKFRGVRGYDLTVDLIPKIEAPSRIIKCDIVDDKGAYFAGGMGIHTATGGLPPSAIHATLLDATASQRTRIPPELIGQWTVSVAERIPDELLDELRRDPKGGLRIKIRLHREGVLLGWDIERRPNPWGHTYKEIVDHIFIPMAHSHTGGDFKEARPAFYTWDGDGFRGLPANIPAFRDDIKYKHPWRYREFVSMPSAEDLGNVVPKEWAEQGLFITSKADPCCDNRVKGALYEKGWYIHPRTKERIETYF